MSEDEGKLLARVDERTENMERQLDRLAADMKENYVTKSDFNPVRAIVFGGVALVLTAFMGALIVMAGLK